MLLWRGLSSHQGTEPLTACAMQQPHHFHISPQLRMHFYRSCMCVHVPYFGHVGVWVEKRGLKVLLLLLLFVYSQLWFWEKMVAVLKNSCCFVGHSSFFPHLCLYCGSKLTIGGCGATQTCIFSDSILGFAFFFTLLIYLQFLNENSHQLAQDCIWLSQRLCCVG